MQLCDNLQLNSVIFSQVFLAVCSAHTHDNVIRVTGRQYTHTQDPDRGLGGLGCVCLVFNCPSMSCAYSTTFEQLRFVPEMCLQHPAGNIPSNSLDVLTTSVVDPE